MAEPNEPPKRNRTMFYITIAFLLFWIGYLRFFGPKQNGPGPRLEGTGLSAPADYSWKLRDLEGRPVEFAKFKGKPVFLNIWATWCGPCVKEMPTIAALAADAKLKGVAFVCVATDDSPGTVKDFLRGKSWPMTILHASEVPPVFVTEGIPATFLIAPDGRVVASVIGSEKWDEPSVVEFLRKLETPG
jgi:thiol-disulfide isomerase/thioredoxin